MLRIVAATRHDPVGFYSQTLLGRALLKFSSGRGTAPVIAHSNARGLPEVFNAALREADEDDAIAFTHDDVWIDDWFVPERLDEALGRFDVVGVAGSRRRLPRQPSWMFVDADLNREDFQHLSGAVAHVDEAKTWISHYGPTPAEVKLLDGVFLAARVRTLRSAGVAFDPAFSFHFYDLDFCRSCERAGLTLGTWPIAITHRSVGGFGSPDWLAAYARYLEKWAE
jgi:GT2 family glycosyltransferase